MGNEISRRMSIGVALQLMQRRQLLLDQLNYWDQWDNYSNISLLRRLLDLTAGTWSWYCTWNRFNINLGALNPNSKDHRHVVRYYLPMVGVLCHHFSFLINGLRQQVAMLWTHLWFLMETIIITIYFWSKWVGALSTSSNIVVNFLGVWVSESGFVWELDFAE